MCTVRIGVSGWDYDDWTRVFYPSSLPKRNRLAYLSARFDTIEVNSTFYGLPRVGACRRWRDTVPQTCILAMKGSRYITHVKRLHDVETALANYLASGPLELGRNLGPFLWQLPASAAFDADRVDTFLALLPHNTPDAVRMAHRHDDRVAEPGYGAGEDLILRHVLEVRHPSFLCTEMVGIARRHGVALAFSHSSRWPYVEEITADFVYLRLHGPQTLYSSAYGPDLERWAARISAWQRGDEPEGAERITSGAVASHRQRDVYVYFDNDGFGFAPKEATVLRRLVNSS